MCINKRFMGQQITTTYYLFQYDKHCNFSEDCKSSAYNNLSEYYLKFRNVFNLLTENYDTDVTPQKNV